MSPSVRRKILYIAAISVMLLPLSMLSRPSAREADGSLNRGGILSRMRDEHGLTLTDLGEIDPASESMKLATLGLRGVATNILWTKANNYKKTKDWDNFRATLNQITKLQPNFISVWIFQGWNLSYNVSVEFDDYRSRYHWVKKGLDFLVEGTKYNRDDPRLIKEIGWFFAHKLGRADERVQYRRLFRDDTDFHRQLRAYIDMDQSLGPDNHPDSWKVAWLWYRKAQHTVDAGGLPIKGESPLIFHSHPPKALIRFAEAIEREGYLDEKAQVAWQRAHQAWVQYGNRELPTGMGLSIRLGDGEHYEAQRKRLAEQLDQLVPGVRDRLVQEKYEKLTPEQQAVWDTPEDQLTPGQRLQRLRISRELEVPHDVVAEQAPPERQGEARKLAARATDADQRAHAIRRDRGTVNYDYWLTRCLAEESDEAISARRYLYEADQAFTDTDLVTAREKYEKAWDYWAQVFERFPSLWEDTTAEDLLEPIRRYRELLRQDDEPFPPPDFKLMRLLEIAQEQGDPAAEGLLGEGTE